MPKLKALTLVELTVSIAITVMLIAVSVPLFNKERGDNLVQKEAQLVAAYIESARSMAQHPESEDAVGYRVKSTGRVLSTLRLESVSGDLTETGTVQNTLTLTRSTADFASNNLDFYVFAGEYRGPAKTITVKLDSNQDIKKSITISAPGVINVAP